MHNQQQRTTPIILALTRRALICGLPYNLFICLLITGCVAMVWIDSLLLVASLFIASFIYCRILSARDVFALDIFIMRMQKIGVCTLAVRQYFNARSYGAE